MGYWDIHDMSTNADLLARVTACAAQEVTDQDYNIWISENMLKVCASPDWDSAWASALANLNITQPGKDPSVITDGMILSAVQYLISKLTLKENTAEE